MEAHALVVADAQGVIRMWSPGAETLFGYAPAEAVGATLDLVVPEPYREAHWKGFHAAMKSDKPQGEQPAAIVPVLCKDGGVERFAVRLIVLRDGLNRTVGALALYARDDGSAPGLPKM